MPSQDLGPIQEYQDWLVSYVNCCSSKQMISTKRSANAFFNLLVRIVTVFFLLGSLFAAGLLDAQEVPPILLQADRMLDVRAGRIVSPAEVLIEGNRIASAGGQVRHPANARIVPLGDVTLMPGLIDAHVHLFLHPGAEDLQTVRESVPRRVIVATLAARADLMAGFTAERDMGTEGAGSADTAVREAIDAGLIPGPRLRVSGNAVDITGGHEDTNHFNPEQHLLSNASRADTVAELISVIRQQFKGGADFIKIYETGRDSLVGRKVPNALSIHGRTVERCRSGSQPGL